MGDASTPDGSTACPKEEAVKVSSARVVTWIALVLCAVPLAYAQSLGGYVITTFAGNGTQGFAGDGGPAINASFRGLNGLAVDALGNLYISDNGDHRIRRV